MLTKSICSAVGLDRLVPANRKLCTGNIAGAADAVASICAGGTCSSAIAAADVLVGITFAVFLFCGGGVAATYGGEAAEVIQFMAPMEPVGEDAYIQQLRDEIIDSVAATIPRPSWNLLRSSIQASLNHCGGACACGQTRTVAGRSREAVGDLMCHSALVAVVYR